MTFSKGGFNEFGSTFSKGGFIKKLKEKYLKVFHFINENTMDSNEEYVIIKKINKDRPKKIIYTKRFDNERERLKHVLKMRQQRENVNKEIRDKEEILEIYDKQLTYDNQKQAAIECKQAFDNGAIAVCLVAQPGTGKTGTALEVMRLYATEEDDNKFIFTEDIIVCSGMSDNDWKIQFRDSLINPFK